MNFIVYIYVSIAIRMYVWLCIFKNQCCIPRVKLETGEDRLSSLTSGPLFPGPGSGGGGQCSGPVVPAWELSVGAWGPWSATNVSIASRLPINEYRSLVSKLYSLLAFAVKQTSNCPQVWLSSYLAAACPVYVPKTH